MFINEVEHIVGLSKKSIRLYEDNGLLSPMRNQDNSYRIYNEEDLKKLRIIKLFRELGVPIREIKLLFNGELNINDCMEDRISKITKEEESLRKIKNICFEISKLNESIDDIDINKYLEEINILNKEGFTMREIKTSKTKKIMGAIFSSFIFSLFFIFLTAIITYFQITEDEKMPWLIFAFMMFMFLIPIIGTFYNLFIRIKEINGGEEDEASKY